MIKIKRAYDPKLKQDGFRLLIDRLWPRGIKKSNLEIDGWEKDLAPSPTLRKNFGHEPRKWAWFRSQYKLELRSPVARDKIKELAKRAARTTVTLIFAAKDVEHSHAKVLKEVLDREVRKVPRNVKRDKSSLRQTNRI